VSPHSGKGFMAGGIQEGNLLPVDCYLVGADVLGDAPGFGVHYISLSDGIKFFAIPVIYMPHDSNEVRSWL